MCRYKGVEGEGIKLFKVRKAKQMSRNLMFLRDMNIGIVEIKSINLKPVEKIYHNVKIYHSPVNAINPLSSGHDQLKIPLKTLLNILWTNSLLNRYKHLKMSFKKLCVTDFYLLWEQQS